MTGTLIMITQGNNDLIKQLLYYACEKAYTKVGE